jgi:hypothetical protein
VLFLGYPDPTVFLNGLEAGLHDLGYHEGQNMELVGRRDRATIRHVVR